jgi:hypothetical protein
MLKKLFIAVILVVLCSGYAIGQMTEEDMKVATPDSRHERLKVFEGEWTSTTNYYMAPGHPASGSGTASNRMILGGRFIEMKGMGEVMGMKYESLSILGFDRRTDKYTLVAFDELGTYYVEAEGDYNEATKVLLLNGTYLEPNSKKDMSYRFVFDISDPNAVKYSVIFLDMPGMPAEFTMVEGIYTKK